MADRITNMRPDPPDLRDRMYSPTLRPLYRSFNAEPQEDPAWRDLIKDQGDTAACTGYALAALVEALQYMAWTGAKERWPKPERISPFMLYAMARRYDDIPGEDAEGGSTARAGMKAWHKHGATRLELWKSIEQDSCTADPKWAADGFARPLGAYYRVDHCSIPDIHAALYETGVVYVTALIHQGWDQPSEDGTIAFEYGAPTQGGHAFLLVGYDEHGFWLQNSWGEGWGKGGFARLSYGDWQANGMDAWIGQLGVHISSQIGDIGHGLNYARAEGGGANPAEAGRSLLSSNSSVSAQQISPYVVNLENNGTLSARGQFHTRVEDLRALVTGFLDSAVAQWGLGENDPIDVALYAHGGLTDEAGAAETARRWIPALFASRIFPVFFMWETGLFDTLGNIVKDQVWGTPGAGAGRFGDWFVDRLDDRVESLLAWPGGRVWGEMKENARFATTNPAGGIALLSQELRAQRTPEFRARLRIHLIGHSAGANFHAYLLPMLLQAGLRVDGVYFMAPACRRDLFEEQVLPHYQAGKVPVYTQFHMTDQVELDDSCPIPVVNVKVYNKSLLYLISNSFEGRRETPLLGMEKFVMGTLAAQKPAPVAVWDWVPTPNPMPPDPTWASMVKSHGDYSRDPLTLNAVLTRIDRRRAAAGS